MNMFLEHIGALRMAAETPAYYLTIFHKSYDLNGRLEL